MGSGPRARGQRLKPGRLHLIPVPIGGPACTQELPDALLTLAASLDCFIAENARTARAFLKALALQKPLQSIEIFELSEHTNASELPGLLAPLLAGREVGLVSEAGCPAIADPGAALVAAAHRAGIEVCPHIGPSSLLLALMASGLEGQRFAFAGYLPAATALRASALQRLEQRSGYENETQLWIETPYRSQAMLASALEHLRPSTQLSLACDLAQSSQWIQMRLIADWRSAPPDISNRLTVYALLADRSARDDRRDGSRLSENAGDRARPRNPKPAPPKRQSASPGVPQRSPAGKSRRRSLP